MQNTCSEMINAFEEFASLAKQENHRALSWEHCYQQFHLARSQENPDVDYLSLQLAFYLASWGMYRGSSFLLQRDYKVHIPIVKEILKPEYDCLQGLECGEFLANLTVQERLMALEAELNKLYKQIRNKNIESAISEILTTKVLLGTLGCTPAYDSFFIMALKKTGVTSGKFTLKKSIQKLAEFYEKNKSNFEAVRSKYLVGNQPCPQMKFLDMALWQIGFHLSENKAKK